MTKKSLLTETEIRQFMKLAQLSPIAETRFDSIAPVTEEDEEDELDATEHELGDMDADVHDKDEEIDDLEADLGAADDDLAMDDADAAPQTIAVDDFLGALEDALEKVTNQPVSTEMSPDEEGGDDEMDMEMDVVDDGGEMEMDMDVEEEPGMRDMYENQDALVQEVARRVAARLIKENSKKQMVDDLTERIMKRLTK